MNTNPESDMRINSQTKSPQDRVTVSVSTRSSDALNTEKINALPHPIAAELYGLGEYEIDLLDVETGLMHVLVSGLVDRMHFIDARSIIDADGVRHDAAAFWND